MTSQPDTLEKKRYTRKAVIVFWIAAAILAAGISPYWRIQPDSALYAGMARAIASGEGYTFSGEVQYSIPPVTPLYLAGAYKLAQAITPGVSLPGAMFYLNAFTAAAGMAALVAAFFLVLELSGPKRALVAVVLVMTNRQFFEGAIVPLTDIPYCALSWTALLFLVRSEKRGGWGNRVAAAALLALSVMTRVVGVTLVAAVAAWGLWRLFRGGVGRKRAPMDLLVTLPAVVAAGVFTMIMLSGRGGTVNYVDSAVDARGAGFMFWRTARNLADTPGYLFESVAGLESAAGLGLAFAALVIAGAVKLRRGPAFIGGAYMALCILFVTASHPMRPRYVLPLLPVIYLFAFEGIAMTRRWVAVRLKSDRAKAALAAAPRVMTAMVVAINCVYVTREIARNSADDFYASYAKGYYRDYLSLASLISHDPAGGAILALRYRTICALTANPAARLPYLPQQAYRPTVDELRQYAARRGIRTVVIDPDDRESAEMLRAFVLTTAGWSQIGQYGRLEYYAHAGGEDEPGG